MSYSPAQELASSLDYRFTALSSGNRPFIFFDIPQSCVSPLGGSPMLLCQFDPFEWDLNCTKSRM